VLWGAEKKPDSKKKGPKNPPSSHVAPKNQADDLIKKANRPTLVGVVAVTNDERGFVRARLEAEDGKVYRVVNPAILENLGGARVKVVYSDLKEDAKTKQVSIRVEEVQKLPR
jgi:hypothetical protein